MRGPASRRRRESYSSSESLGNGTNKYSLLDLRTIRGRGRARVRCRFSDPAAKAQYLGNCAYFSGRIFRLMCSNTGTTARTGTARPTGDQKLTALSEINPTSMSDPEATSAVNGDTLGRKTPPSNGNTKSDQASDENEVAGRSHGFICHVCRMCAAENWIDPGWLVFRCWSCGASEKPTP
jgi:hypothetical protein